MKYALIIMAVCFAINTTTAQENSESTATSTENSEDWNFKGAQKIIKISPLDIASFVPTLGLDMEIKLQKRTSVEFGAAVVPSFMQILTSETFNDYDRMGGYKLRAEGRLYTPNFSKFYFAVGISFRHLIIRDEVPVGMEGITNEFGQETFAYFVNTPMVFNRFNANYDFKWGVQLKTKENLAFDFYTGLSIRHVSVFSKSTLPDGGQIPELRGVWTVNDGYRSLFPVPVIGVKIGIVR